MTVTRPAAWPCAAVALILAGCALSPPRALEEDPRQAFSERVEEMRSVDEWELRGRLAVKTRNRGESITMFWRRGGADHYINLYGPMGAGRVILTQGPEGATLRDSEGRTHQDESAERLLYRVAGWRVPFESMQHWVLGVAAPDSEYEMELDGWGRLSTLTQNGWKIRFQEYHYIDGQDMPRRLVMNALPGTEHIVDDETGESESIQVKAIIKRWQWAEN